MRKQLYTFPLLLMNKVYAAPPANFAQNNDDGKASLPPELTPDTFDRVVSEKLAFVEFYSPYCSHCKELAPVWKAAYSASLEERKKLGIDMRQVNCVESGDLCERENINYYPNLRLYAPSQTEGVSVGKHIDTFPRTLSKTAENFQNYLINSVAEFDSNTVAIPSSSEQLDIDLGLNIVAGEAGEPYFVALFSSTDEEYHSNFPESCLDCVEHRRNWDRLSNLVISFARTGHLNCHSHPILCKKLGFPLLANKYKVLSPRYIMFVPRSAGRIRFDYPNEAVPELSQMKSFVTKLSLNYKYEEVDVNDLEDLKVVGPENPADFKGAELPLENKLALVFSYDKKAATPEDKAIMPYLLEMVTQLPFNIDLYISSSDKLDKVIERDSMALVDYVNRDESFEKRSFDRKLHLSTLLTLKPTLYIFKENSLAPVVFQSFALEDMRMPDKIRKFVQKDLKPMLGELTPHNFKFYFSKSSANSKDNRDDKVSITFVDPGNQSELEEILFHLSLVSHQYHLERNEYFYAKLLKDREMKEADVAKLKENNADSTKIIQRMKELIPHLFRRADVAFTYVDLKQFPTFAEHYGFNIDGGSYMPGDTIIVDKSLKRYWDQNLSGTQLKSTPPDFRGILKYLLDPSLNFEKPYELSSKLVGSPYHRYLRGLDFVHQYGFYGYVLGIMLVYVILLLFKRLSRTRFSRRPRADVLIGAAYSKAD